MPSSSIASVASSARRSASRQLEQIRHEIFQTTSNPQQQRTGAKYLRQRLVGPSMMQYYPPQISVSRILNDPALIQQARRNLLANPHIPNAPRPSNGIQIQTTAPPTTGGGGSTGGVSNQTILTGENTIIQRPSPAFEGTATGAIQDDFLHLMKPHEIQRFIDVARRKAMGKGPPKKGKCRYGYLPGFTCLTPRLLSYRRRTTSGHEGWQEEVKSGRPSCIRICTTRKRCLSPHNIFGARQPVMTIPKRMKPSQQVQRYVKSARGLK